MKLIYRKETELVPERKKLSEFRTTWGNWTHTGPWRVEGIAEAQTLVAQYTRAMEIMNEALRNRPANMVYQVLPQDFIDYPLNPPNQHNVANY